MQEERKPADEVLYGLETTSDKIRALARAGYLRTEIRDLLGIRYQHVRKVLEDAGIQDGLQRVVDVERSPLPVMIAEDETPSLVLPETLLEAGFQEVGYWTTEEGALRIVGAMLREAGVYAFVLDDEIVYVGLTLNGLRVRMDQYRRGHVGQRTSARVNQFIRNALDAGHKVRIFMATPPALEWNGLPVNGAAGLEAGLIALIRPPWNIQGAG